MSDIRMKSRLRPILGLCLGMTALLLMGCATSSTHVIPDDLPDGVTHLQTYRPDPGSPGIAFEKYRLDNGLTVILHEDRSDPLVHVDMRYHVGSNREQLGRSGFGHLFEHMMFQGSAHVADEEHFKIVSEAGGSANGEITDDWTNYYQTVPSGALETMLWLEADRMGFLLADITQEKFEVQRDAVKNERDQKFDNVPYGVVVERMGEALYPHAHPYSWHRIGYVEDLNAATLDDVTAFFQNWYGPNNAVLTIGGHFDRPQTLRWIVKYFETIPSGPTVVPLSMPTATLSADRYISMEDNIEQPLLRIDYPLDLTQYGSDEAALDVWSVLVGNRNASPLHKVFVDAGLAENVSVVNSCRELSCVLSFEILLPRDGRLSFADAEALIDDTVSNMMSVPLDDAEIRSVVNGIVADKVFALETVHQKVDYLSLHETLLDRPDYFASDIERYETVTANDILRVYNTHLVDNSAVIMRVVPNGRMDLVIPADNWDYPGRNIPVRDTTVLRQWSAPTDTFDRSVRPDLGTAATTTLPDITEFALSNAIPVLSARNAESPITTIEILFDIGMKDDPNGMDGMTRLTSAMFEESTVETAAETLSAQLDTLGASLDINVGSTHSAMRLKTPSQNAEASFGIVAKRLLTPKFDAGEFATVKRRSVSSAQAALKRADFVASTLFNRLVYGPKNHFASPSLGLPDTLDSITLTDVKRHYDTHYRADRMQVLIVSDLDPTALSRLLAPLEAVRPGTGYVFNPAPIPTRDQPVIYIVDKPGATQSQIRIGKATDVFDNTGPHFRQRLANYMFGEDFNSRLNAKLREEKGYTYGIHSGVSANEHFGKLRIDTGVRTDATIDALKDILAEMGRMAASGLTEEELAATKAYFSQSGALNFESQSQKIFLLSRLAIHDLDRDYLETRADALAATRLDSLNDLARDFFNIQDQIIVVVGSKADIFDGLLELGYPVIEVTETGRAVTPH